MTDSNFNYQLFHDDGANYLETNAPYRRGYTHLHNLDSFLSKVYNYYAGKGFLCITLSKGLNLVSLLWVIFLASFLLTSVDYGILFDTYNLKQAVYFRGFHPFLVICLLIFCVFWLWQCVQFVIESRDNLEIRQFYQQDLRISENDLQTIEWSRVVSRIVRVPGLCITKPDITALDIANRIMRKENYLITLINKGILKLNIPLPYFGNRNMVTKTIEWSLSFTIFSYVFDPRNLDGINKNILDPNKTHELAQGLKKRFQMMGLVSLLLSPFIFVFLLVYFVFKYGEEIRARPGSFTARQWSPLARWKFRELNELPHIFTRRLNASVQLAERYVNSFPFDVLTIVARFVSFVVGSIVVVLLLIGLYDDEALFNVELLHGRSALWFVGVGGSIVALCRAVIPDSSAPATGGYVTNGVAVELVEPEKIMEDLVQYTHYLPKSWKGNAHTIEVLNEFTQLFEFKIVIFFVELLSVLFAPFILLVSLSNSAESVIAFFRDFTVNEPGVGDVCKFAVFPLEEHGNPAYGFNAVGSPRASRVDVATSPMHSTHSSRSSLQDKRWLFTKQGKMEKSFLNFKANNPEWKPSKQGEKYLQNLADALSTSTIHQNYSLDGSTNMPYAASSENLNTSTPNYQLNQMMSSLLGTTSPNEYQSPSTLNNNNQTFNSPAESPGVYLHAERQRLQDSIAGLNMIHRHFYRSNQQQTNQELNNSKLL